MQLIPNRSNRRSVILPPLVFPSYIMSIFLWFLNKAHFIKQQKCEKNELAISNLAKGVGVI